MTRTKPLKVLCALFFFCNLSLAMDSGSYWVASPAELVPYSVFPLTDAKVVTNDNEITLSYSLPLEIVQESHRVITVVGHREPGEMSFSVKGGNTNGTCRVAKNGITCMLIYTFDITTSLVRPYLKKHHPETYKERSSLLDFFGNEPGGVVFFEHVLP